MIRQCQKSGPEFAKASPYVGLENGGEGPI